MTAHDIDDLFRDGTQNEPDCTDVPASRRIG